MSHEWSDLAAPESRAALPSSFANFEISRSHHPMQERKAKAMFVAKVAVAAMAEKATTLQITAVVMMSR
jgi:hypothetical protein